MPNFKDYLQWSTKTENSLKSYTTHLRLTPYERLTFKMKEVRGFGWPPPKAFLVSPAFAMQLVLDGWTPPATIHSLEVILSEEIAPFNLALLL